MSGKQHCVRLIPTGALDGYGVEWIKLTDTKGCSTCCIGKPTRLNRYVLCVAMKRHVLIYEITRDKGRHRRLREIALDFNPQSLDVRGDKLFVGFPSTFGVFSLVDDTASCKQLFLFTESYVYFQHRTNEYSIDWLIDRWIICIIQRSWFIFLFFRLFFSSLFFILHENVFAGWMMGFVLSDLITRDFYGTKDDASSLPRFLLQENLDALMAIDISEKEYLFVFSGTLSLCLGHSRMEGNFFPCKFFRLSGLGIYLDEKGRTSRSREIMFTATPVAVGENFFYQLFHTDIPPHKVLLPFSTNFFILTYLHTKFSSHFVAFSRPNLLIYTETHIAVYDVVSGDWIQTINLRRVRFLLRISLCVSCVLAYDKSHHDFFLIS